MAQDWDLWRSHVETIRREAAELQTWLDDDDRTYMGLAYEVRALVGGAERTAEYVTLYERGQGPDDHVRKPKARKGARA